MNDTKLFYDLTAKKYADEWYPNNMMLPAIKEFIKLFQSNPKILDLGCGPGNESMRLSNEGADVIGIDYSEACIKIAKERNLNIEFKCIDFFDINESLGKFDGIFSCSSLIHLNEKDIDIVLNRISGLIKKSGYFLIIYRRGEGQIRQQPEIDSIKLERIIEQYTTEKIKEIFEKNGYIYFKDGQLDDMITKFWHSIIFMKK